MIKFLDIISKFTKYCFYGLMLFFVGILISILLGYFKFAVSQVPFYFMISVACVALISFISSDLLHILKKKKTITSLIPEAVEEPVEETETTADIQGDTDKNEDDETSK